ncbi:efflux RND transporter periplasmic adaptor subunit [bacterium]|nr:efflux RND transporter periplasmic adaptor subunit [bacterium]
MKKAIIITIGVLVFAVMARFLIYQFNGWKEAEKRRNAAAPGVVVQEIETKDVIRKFESPGRIVSVSRINVVARISGYLIKAYFKEGDYVKKGQVLFEIEPHEYKLAVEKAKANLNNSQAQLTYYEKQLVRARELVKQDYIAKAKYDETLAQRDSYKAQVDLNKSAYEDALRNLSYTKVIAPVDGQVGMIHITVGNYVTAQSGALTTINSIDPIYVSFPMDTKNYEELVRVDKDPFVKRKVDLYFPSGSKYEHIGTQDFHDNNVDETTGSIMMRATFPNPNGELINGDYASVYVYSSEKENVPVVPQVAVMENPQYKYVYKLDEKGLPQVQKIETMGQEGQDWIIKSGLVKGDKVVVDGLQRVIPGNKIRIMSDEEIQQMKEKMKEEQEKLEEENKNDK